MSVEDEIFDLYKELEPSTAFSQGIKGCAGKMFVPTIENKKLALGKIAKIRRKTKDKHHRAILKMFETSLSIEEPQDPVGSIFGVLYNYMLIEGVNPRNMLPLVEDSLIYLRISKLRFGGEIWPVEIKILTLNQANGLLELIDSITNQNKHSKLNKKLEELKLQVQDYKKSFYVEGIKKGDFTEVYPILQKQGGYLGRKKDYPAILRDIWGMPLTHQKIENRALKLLDEYLPRLHEITRALADKYGVEPTVEAVENTINKHSNLKRKDLVKTVEALRKDLQPLAEKKLVNITPNYHVKVIETPSFLVNFMPTAAMQPLDTFTKKPHNIFFVTTEGSGSPEMSAPEIANTLIHEEYGHCVNFSNSADPEFQRINSKLDLIDLPFATAISEGYAFYIETIENLDRLDDPEYISGLHTAFQRFGDPYAMIDEMRFALYKWKVVRYIRAILDVRVNMDKQTIVEVVDWAHKKTGLSKKLIYNQTFFFQENPGYMTNYSMVGHLIEDIRKKAEKKGIDRTEFNTFVSAMGFAPMSILSERMEEFVKSYNSKAVKKIKKK
jgi:hypothetical protein